MCKFCEGLFEKKYEMRWNMRSNCADDNFCEKILNDTCENCSECSINYILRGRKIDETGHVYIQCDYKFDNGDIVMWNSTEPLNINYCPYCGKQLADSLVSYEDIGNHISDMEDDKGESWDYESYKIEKIKDKTGVYMNKCKDCKYQILVVKDEKEISYCVHLRNKLETTDLKIKKCGMYKMSYEKSHEELIESLKAMDNLRVLEPEINTSKKTIWSKIFSFN